VSGGPAVGHVYDAAALSAVVVDSVEEGDEKEDDIHFVAMQQLG